MQGGKLHPLMLLLTSAVRTAEEPNVLFFWVPYGTPALLTVDVEKGLPEMWGRVVVGNEGSHRSRRGRE